MEFMHMRMQVVLVSTLSQELETNRDPWYKNHALPYYVSHFRLHAVFCSAMTYLNYYNTDKASPMDSNTSLPPSRPGDWTTIKE